MNNWAGLYCSNVKHIEEIRAAGYELPAVNQVEVDFITYYYFFF